MPAPSRLKNGVASLAYVAGIHVLIAMPQQRRGWHELSNALKTVRGLGHEAFSHADWEILNDLIHAVDLATNRR